MFEEGKIYVLDGATGTQLQALGLSGDSEAFNLSDPGAIEGIHRAYIEAGADIIETNTFGANAIVQAEYGLADKARRMALEGARIARRAADAAPRRILVAGSVGPTSKSLSMAADASDPTRRDLTFDELAAAYSDQIGGLIEGGADFILLETCTDALNAKAAIYALRGLDKDFPIAISVSCPDRSGRTLTGQTLRAFYESVRHARPVAFGLNCSLGAEQMIPLMREVASFAECPTICYPNAGLPDGFGGYTDSPDRMAEMMRRMAAEGLVNIAGGCCGSTPDHIKEIRSAIAACAPAKRGASRRFPAASGLEPVEIDLGTFNFTNIGERTNVAGSRKFARLVAEGKLDEALAIARSQIEGGARIIDVNMDDAMLDSAAEMQRFIRAIQGEPDVAKAALMIDSSHWETILAGLKNAQGRCIVNSISLKEGPAEFVRKAKEINALGAAMVVMAFDESGQATTCGRKTEICRRAYKLLTDAGIPASDIIFDVNVLSVGTGTGEDTLYALDFIEAVRWIKQNLKGALTSGGISNLSFAFRGNNTVREAMHSVFLYHAVAAGLDMAIVNPGMLRPYEAIDPALRQAVEDVILARREDAAEALLAIARDIARKEQDAKGAPGEAQTAPEGPADVRDLLVRGSSEGLEEALQKALGECGSPSAVIEGPLLEAMGRVGEMFADGRLFLPQVVKSARIMKMATAILEPLMKGAEISSARRPKVVLATVRGDVHDIGKNITGTVLQCNGFDVVDLGVMVPEETILERAAAEKADLIGVSGLITPSLERMEALCAEMARRGLDTPLLVGGATTSALHTAVKLAPLYPHVFHRADASATAVLAQRLLADRAAAEAEEHAAQRRLRELHEGSHRQQPARQGILDYLSPDGWAPAEALEGQDIEVREVPKEEVLPFFDWSTFRAIWGLKASDAEKPGYDEILQEASDALANLECSIRCALHWTALEGCSAPSTGLFAACVHHDHACCPCCDDLLHDTLCLTLADAAAEWIQSKVRVPAGFKAIRPAVGYPSCPDHALKRVILDRIPGSDALGITLTESYAMMPQASVCGLIAIHREARYL